MRTKLVKALLPKSGSKNFFKILDLYSKIDIWNYLGGYENANELVRFAKNGYDDLLVKDHDLSAGDSILVIGAYHGSSIVRWLENYDVEVLAIEPVDTFVEVLMNKFKDNKLVQIFPIALGNKSGLIDLSVDEYSTSSYGIHGITQRFLVEDIGQFLKNLKKLPKVMEINIEGGEYDVLQRLIDLDLLRSIDSFVIQFHNFNIKCEVARAQIRMELSQTHRCVFNYEWVWERWEKSDFL